MPLTISPRMKAATKPIELDTYEFPALPTTDFLSETTERIAAGVKRLENQIGAVAPLENINGVSLSEQIEAQSQTLKSLQAIKNPTLKDSREVVVARKKLDLLTEFKLIKIIKEQERALVRIQEELSEALGCEKPVLEKQIQEFSDSLPELNKQLEVVQRRLRGMLNSAKQNAILRHEEEKKFIEQVLKSYPDAQIIDLSCLSHFLNEKGLPALTLFDPDNEVCRILLSDDSGLQPKSYKSYAKDHRSHFNYLHMYAETYKKRHYYLEKQNDLSCWISRSLNDTLLLQIESATGVVIGKKKPTSYFDGREVGHHAKEIELKATFAAGGRTIPKNARAIIKEAKISELFDSVLLLAEARKWNLRYRLHEGADERKFKPIIEGEVIPTIPPGDDPLIIGLKTLSDGRRYAICIGQFDTTPIEEIVREEFCRKP